MPKDQPKHKKKPGPQAERLKLNMDWEEAAKVISAESESKPDDAKPKENDKPKPSTT